MEKLTITKVGTEKQVTTKFGPKTKMGVQFKEYGELWHDVWTGGLKVGDILEGTRASREWEGKTYWDFKLPKKDDKVVEMLSQLLTKVGSINAKIDYLQEKLYPREKAVAESINDYPNEELGEPQF